MKDLSPRTIRRAVARQAAKLAAKASTQVMTASAAVAGAVTLPHDEQEPNVDFSSSLPSSPEPQSAPPVPTAARPLSPAQLSANRANALKSTGPSEAGKAKSRMNALRTGLTGRTVLIH